MGGQVESVSSGEATPEHGGFFRRMSPSNRWLLGVVLLVLATAAAAVIVALTEREVELDPSTPGGTVQVYLRAIGERVPGLAVGND